jgi:hypothetical protein
MKENVSRYDMQVSFEPFFELHTEVLNELCFWTLSIVWCLKNK